MRTLQDIQREENCGLAKALRVEATERESSLAQAPGSASRHAERTFTLDSCPPTRERAGLLLREAVCAAEYLLQNGAMKVAIFEEPTKKDSVDETQRFAIFNVLVNHCGEELTADGLDKIMVEILSELRHGPCSWAFKPNSELSSERAAEHQTTNKSGRPPSAGVTG